MGYDRRLVASLMLFLTFLATCFATVEAGEITGRIFESDGKKVTMKGLIKVKAYDRDGVKKAANDFDPTDDDHLIIQLQPNDYRDQFVELRFYRASAPTVEVRRITGLRVSKKSQTIDVILKP